MSNSELFQDVVHMVLDCAQLDAELPSDLLIREAERNQVDYFFLSSREPRDWPRSVAKLRKDGDSSHEPRGDLRRAHSFTTRNGSNRRHKILERTVAGHVARDTHLRTSHHMGLGLWHSERYNLCFGHGAHECAGGLRAILQRHVQQDNVWRELTDVSQTVSALRSCPHLSDVRQLAQDFCQPFAVEPNRHNDK